MCRLAIILVILVVVSGGNPALVVADASETGAGQPASKAIIDQTKTLFSTLESRIRRKDSRVVNLFTEEGLTAVFGTTDHEQVLGGLDFFKMKVYGVTDVRILEEENAASRTISTVVSYTGLGIPTPMYVSSRFSLVQADDELAIDGLESAPLFFPDDIVVRKVTMTVTLEELEVTSTIKSGDVLRVRVDNQTDTDVVVGVYRLASATYEEVVAAGLPLDRDAKVVAFSITTGPAEFAFADFEKGDYLVVTDLGPAWATGRTAHFTIK